MNFGLIGDGRIAVRHKEAIKRIGGQIVAIHDPYKVGDNYLSLGDEFFKFVDWVVITSPTYCHYAQVKEALKHGKKVICEKPYVLPWQPVIDSDDVRIVLQLRWLDLPKMAKRVCCKATRNAAYFVGWKGNPFLTGGLFFDIFIHYIDLAWLYQCDFEGLIVVEGLQERRIDGFDLMNIDMNLAYEKMYQEIVFEGGGIKPFYMAELYWLLSKLTGRFGFGQKLLGKKIEIKASELIQPSIVRNEI